MKLYAEIKEAYAEVLEAEDNSLLWKEEAKARMKVVDAHIKAARIVNPDMKIDRAELIKKMRSELRPTTPADETPEIAPPDETEVGDSVPNMENNSAN